MSRALAFRSAAGTARRLARNALRMDFRAAVRMASLIHGTFVSARLFLVSRREAPPLLVFRREAPQLYGRGRAQRDPSENVGRGRSWFSGAKRRYTDGVAALRDPREKLRAAHEKRHPPVPVRIVALEPEQQVGRTAAGKAFRSRRTCTILPASPDVPGCFKLGSEVTRSACRTPQATQG